MYRFNGTNLPVQEKNKDDYRKAITRMRACGIRIEACWPGDIIAYQEQEIKRYRAEIERLREIIEDTERDTNVQIEGCTGELVAEGIAMEDVPKINKDDALILRVNRKHTKESMMDLQNEITERTGLRVMLLNEETEIIGVMEHGA